MFLKIFKENKNTDIFFKNEIEVEEVCIDEKNEITELTIYKENKIIAFLKKILNFFRKFDKFPQIHNLVENNFHPVKTESVENVENLFFLWYYMI